jgi:hypothetical protein
MVFRRAKQCKVSRSFPLILRSGKGGRIMGTIGDVVITIINIIIINPYNIIVI